MLVQRTEAHVFRAFGRPYRGSHGHLEADTQGPNGGQASTTARGLHEHTYNARHGQLIRCAETHHTNHTAGRTGVQWTPRATAHGDREPTATRSRRSEGRLSDAR
jgi:hypothetical protein